MLSTGAKVNKVRGILGTNAKVITTDEYTAKCVETVTLVCGRNVNEYTEGELVDLLNTMALSIQSMKQDVLHKKENIERVSEDIKRQKESIFSAQEDAKTIKEIIKSLK